MIAIRVLLADDHALVRAGIRMVLESIDGVEVVAETEDGRQTLALVEKLDPDVVILDIAMPGLNGIEVAARIRSRFPRTRSMILSMHGEAEYVAQALRAGATGYLIKDAVPAELELGLKAVARGETFLCTRISAEVVAKYLQSPDIASSPLSLLTPRQREVLKLIAEGRTTKQMAAELNVSIKTIETHRAQLMERLDIHETAGLVRFAVRVGIV